MSARQPFTPTPSRPSSRATNPDQSLPSTSARSRLIQTHSSALPPAQPSSHSNSEGGQDGSMQPLNLTGLKTNKQMRKSTGGAQRVPHNAANAPPQPQSAIPLRNRASLSAPSSSSAGGGGGGGGGELVAPRPLSPYVSAASIGDMDLDMAFKTPALPFPPGFYATNLNAATTATTAAAAVGAMPAAATASASLATANAASAEDDTHTHISTDNHSRLHHQHQQHQPQPQRREQNPFAHSHSLDSDGLDPDPDDSGYASSTATSHVAHISTPSTGTRNRTRKRAAYVDVDGEDMNGEVGMDGYGEDRQGKRFRYDLEEEEGRESGGAEFLVGQQAQQQEQEQEQEIASRRSSVGVGDRQTPVLMMRPPSVVAYQRHSSHGQHPGHAQPQAQHPNHSESEVQAQTARTAFFEAIIGLDVDLDEGEIERYARAFEGYQARWTRDHDDDDDNHDEGANEQGQGQGQGQGHRLGLEEWDRAGDELVGKFERVVKSWKEDMVATVTSYQSISQDLDDRRALLAERAHEYQTVKESIVRDRGGFRV